MANITDSLLASITWFNWINLAVALFLFLGPGYLFSTFFTHRLCLSFAQKVALSLGLSISLWSILLAWLYTLRIALSPLSVTIILGLAWIIALWRARPRIRINAPHWRTWDRAADLLFWCVLLLAVLAGVLSLRHVVVGPGSDSYHHTLITQLIVDHGMLPDNYEPYAPLVSFTYHFGFHGTAAAMVWLTGLSPIAITPVLAEILVGAAALSTAFFVQTAFRNRMAALISAGVVGLVSVFPAYYMNWGRYTQLTGLVLLPLLFGLVWEWAESDFPKESIPPIGVLAAGIALAHYRVTLMAGLGVVVIIVFTMMRHRDWRQVIRGLGEQLGAAALAGILTAPWIWHVLAARQLGYPVDPGNAKPEAFSLDRISSTLSYPTNIPVIGIAVVAIVLALWRRERVVLALTTWAITMVLLSGPQLAGTFMDTVSVIISLFFPLAVAIGWLAVFTDRTGVIWRLGKWGVYAVLIVLAVGGTVGIVNIIEPKAAYVGSDDLRAMKWIEENKPQSARFMVNTFHWDFLPTYVIGSDAGYWMPLLARRSPVAVPMVYTFERASSADLNHHLVALDRLEGDLTSPEALATMRREGITDVYVGNRGGPIAVDKLIKSPEFKLDFQFGSAYVFSFATTH